MPSHRGSTQGGGWSELTPVNCSAFHGLVARAAPCYVPHVPRWTPLLFLPLLSCGKAFKSEGEGPGFDTGNPDGPGDDTGVTEASIVFTSPGSYVENPVTFSVAVAGPVYRVEYWQEDESNNDIALLGQSADSASGFAIEYEFATLGEIKVEARGFDAAGAQVVDARVRFRVTDLNRGNHLGVWSEGLSGTGLDSHAELAERLATHGIKRLYLKVAEGSADCDLWPDNCDPEVPAAYHAEGVEVWAYGVARPSDPEIQALALTLAADVGYDGYVIHLGADWSGQTDGLTYLLQAFRMEYDESIEADRVPDAWPLWVSVPGDAPSTDFALDTLSTYVTGYLPRVYGAEGGVDVTTDPQGAIEAVRCAFRDAGVTLPMHVVGDSTSGELSAAESDTFLTTAGEEGSLWKVPDETDRANVWATWSEVDWARVSFPGTACN